MFISPVENLKPVLIEIYLYDSYENLFDVVSGTV